MKTFKNILKKFNKKSIVITSVILVAGLFWATQTFVNNSSDTLVSAESKTSSVSSKQDEKNSNTISSDEGTLNDKSMQKATYKKDENIYGVLDLDGKLNQMFVVNQFEVEKKGLIEDYGVYDKILNLTNTKEVSSKNNKQSFVSDAGYFYYQGNVKDGQLPWKFSIKYYLDGKEKNAKKLAGKEGKLKIKIKVKENKKLKNKFYENFMLQISLTLDNDKATNIKAKDAQIADAGNSKQLNFTLMPGNDASYSVSASIKDFEMSGISIAAVPFSMNINMPDTDSMTDGMTDLVSGVEKLDKAAGRILKGTYSLKEGISSYVSGIKKLNKGIKSINTNFSKISSGGKKLSKSSTKIGSGLNKLSKNGLKLKEGSEGINQALLGLKKKLSQMDLSGLKKEDKEMLQGLINGLAKNYDTFNSGIKSYTGGLASLASGYDKFNNGLTEYTNGIVKMEKGFAKLANGSQKIADGGDGLISGFAKFANGLNSYKNGIHKMANGVEDMPEKIDEKVDEMMKDYKCDYTPESFTSKKNKEISAIQFVLKTDDIKKKEEVKEVKEEEDEGLMGRLANLFE